ncbi:MAG: nitroreductase family protein [Spirochaetota bacterium]|jgi:nitroreductase
MNILHEIEDRRARRGLSEEPIDERIAAELVYAATLAPSCFNNQPWRIVMVSNEPGSAQAEGIRAALTPGNAWAQRASWFFVLCTAAHLDCRMDEGRDYAYFDLGQAAMAIELQAQHEGLIAHPMAGFSPSKVRAALSIPKEIVPLVVLAIGKPGPTDALSEQQKASENSERIRKPLGEVVFSGSFGNPFQG